MFGIICFLRLHHAGVETTLSTRTVAPKLFSATDLVNSLGISMWLPSFRDVDKRTGKQPDRPTVFCGTPASQPTQRILAVQHRGQATWVSSHRRRGKFLAVDLRFPAVHPLAVPASEKEGHVWIWQQTSVPHMRECRAQIFGPARGGGWRCLLRVVGLRNSQRVGQDCRSASRLLDVLGIWPCSSTDHFCT